MATVGAAGAVGAGTYSRFTDEENKRVTVSAGTLDLTVDGYNGTTVEVDGGPLRNGEVLKDCETIRNIGDIGADQIEVGLSSLKDYENGIEEPEQDAGDTSGSSGEGELSQYLTVKGSVCDNPCIPGGVSVDKYIDLQTAVKAGTRTAEVNLPPSSKGGSGSETCQLCFYVKLDEDTPNANDAMSDKAQFDIDLTLIQNRENEGTVTATDNTGGS